MAGVGPQFVGCVGVLWLSVAVAGAAAEASGLGFASSLAPERDESAAPLVSRLGSGQLPGSNAGLSSPEQTHADDRAIRLRVAYPPQLRARSNWVVEFRCALGRANALLRPALGRELEVAGKVAWLGGTENHSPKALLNDLAAGVARGDGDIVVGLAVATGPVRSGAGLGDSLRATTERGQATFHRGYLVLKVGGGDLCDVDRLLAHEIAHLFGAVHLQGRNNLMNPFSAGTEIDPLTTQLLLLHRNRTFPDTSGLSFTDRRKLVRMADTELMDPTSWVVLGALAAKLGDLGAAVQYAERATEMNPDYTTAHVNLGHALFQLGNLARAEECYLRALELRPDHALVHNNLAVLYYGTGSLERAVFHLKKALELEFEADPEFIRQLELATGEEINTG